MCGISPIRGVPPLPWARALARQPTRPTIAIEQRRTRYRSPPNQGQNFQTRFSRPSRAFWTIMWFAEDFGCNRNPGFSFPTRGHTCILDHGLTRSSTPTRTPNTNIARYDCVQRSEHGFRGGGCNRGPWPQFPFLVLFILLFSLLFFFSRFRSSSPLARFRSRSFFSFASHRVVLGVS